MGEQPYTASRNSERATLRMILEGLFTIVLAFCVGVIGFIAYEQVRIWDEVRGLRVMDASLDGRIMSLERISGTVDARLQRIEEGQKLMALDLAIIKARVK